MPPQERTELRSISHYDLLEEVGRGGMGVVYKARDRKLDRTVALKFLKTDYIASSREKTRFIREARAISRLNHRHIAVIHGIEEAEGKIFLVFEYLPGGTLRSRLAALPEGLRLPPPQITSYGLQMAEALGHAHANGVIHRDVKPGNVMFNDDGDLKLVDFGLSKLAGGVRLTNSGARMGTPLYMSPEQAEGGEIDERSDIFSLGVVIYEMAAGRPPFVSDQPAGIAYKIVHQAAPPLTESNPNCPARLDAIIARAMEKSPDARYQSMRDLAADLRSFLHGAAGDSSPTATLTMLASPPTRPRWVWVLAAVLIVAIAATLLAVVGNRFWYRLPDEKRLVVLPFENVGNDPANQALCDGLLESATNMLAQLEYTDPKLVVTPVSEVRRQSIQTAETAHKLAGANLAIAGKFQRAGTTASLGLTLEDARTGRVLRSATLSYVSGQTAAIQEQLAGAVMKLLNLTRHNATHFAGSSLPAANESYLLGTGYLQRFDLPGNLDKALTALDGAVRADPKFVAAHEALSAAYRRKYFVEKNRAFLDAARVQADQALDLDGSSSSAHVAKGVVLSLAGDHAAAAAELRRALSIDPLDVEALRELASVYDSLGQVSEAEEIYRKAIQMKPSEWVTYADLGVFHNSHQKYSEAESDFRAQESLTPDSPLVHRNLGGVYVALGRFPDAEKELLTSIQLQPAVTAYTNLGALYIFEARYRDAIGALEKATQLAPPAYRNAFIMWANLADAYRYTPDQASKAPATYRRAIEAAEQQLAFDPENGNLLSYVAVYWAKLGDRNRALDEIARAIRFAQGNRNLSFRASLVYELAGERERALAALGDAIQGGYSLDEIDREPELRKLREDSRYQQLIHPKHVP
jgi:tetratricopeptide (TPR) repeat protein/tRNA A-37 threonylcarbamoyl transferase component Bud32